MHAWIRNGWLACSMQITITITMTIWHTRQQQFWCVCVVIVIVIVIGVEWSEMYYAMLSYSLLCVCVFDLLDFFLPASGNWHSVEV